MDVDIPVTTWQTKRLFEETNLHMLQNEILCDVTFLVGNNKQEIKAHKFLLASRCKSFYTMFCHSSMETHNIIEVPDIDYKIMKSVLRYIYTEDCEINIDTVIELLLGAKKYNLSRLQEKCRAFLATKLSPDTVCMILKNILNIGEKELEQKCLAFILENGNEALKSDGFVTLPKTIVQKIIMSDNLHAEEVDVYEACKKWAAAENCRQETSSTVESNCGSIRKQLGNMLHLIRFPIMSFETFASTASKDEILTADEKVSIFHSIANKSASTVCKFNSKERKRKFKAAKRIVIKRFQNTPMQEWMYNGLPDSLSFRVSEKAKFLGVSMFSPINAGKITGLLKLLKGSSEILFEKNVEIRNGPNKISEEVLLDNGVELEPGQLYTLYSKFKGGYSCYGTGGQKTVSEKNVAVTFIENDFSLNGTDTNEGQFNYIILQESNCEES